MQKSQFVPVTNYHKISSLKHRFIVSQLCETDNRGAAWWPMLGLTNEKSQCQGAALLSEGFLGRTYFQAHSDCLAEFRPVQLQDCPVSSLNVGWSPPHLLNAACTPVTPPCSSRQEHVQSFLHFGSDLCCTI